MRHKHRYTMIPDDIRQEALVEDIGQFGSAKGTGNQHVFFV
jgi:hypothetical protein